MTKKQLKNYLSALKRVYIDVLEYDYELFAFPKYEDLDWSSPTPIWVSCEEYPTFKNIIGLRLKSRLK